MSEPSWIRNIFVILVLENDRIYLADSKDRLYNSHYISYFRQPSDVEITFHLVFSYQAVLCKTSFKAEI